MKKLLAGIFALVMLVTMLAGCGACQHEWNGIMGTCKKCDMVCAHQYNEKGKCTICKFSCSHQEHSEDTMCCTECGLLVAHNYTDGKCQRCDATSIFEYKAVDVSYQEPCATPGTIVEVTYDTYAYAVEKAAGIEAKTIPVLGKVVNVYLPHGYDSAKQYNIIYLLHGMGGDEDTWFGMEPEGMESDTTGWFKKTVAMMDHVIANKEADPCIVVTPTFYFSEASEDSEYASYNEEAASLLTECFQFELLDIIAKIETEFSTYAAGNVSRENLAATREHRAFAGLSMGSITTFQSGICGTLDIFGYIGSFSCGWNNLEAITSALTDTFAEYPVLYWYHGEGTIDYCREDHITIYNQMKENLSGVLVEGEGSGQNMVMVDKVGYAHDAANWYIDLYNILHIFFKK